jgi:hypothetical protein
MYARFCAIWRSSERGLRKAPYARRQGPLTVHCRETLAKTGGASFRVRDTDEAPKCKRRRKGCFGLHLSFFRWQLQAVNRTSRALRSKKEARARLLQGCESAQLHTSFSSDVFVTHDQMETLRLRSCRFPAHFFPGPIVLPPFDSAFRHNHRVHADDTCGPCRNMPVDMGNSIGR